MKQRATGREGTDARRIGYYIRPTDPSMQIDRRLSQNVGAACSRRPIGTDTMSNRRWRSVTLSYLGIISGRHYKTAIVKIENMSL